jgi:metal-responsive CopG/Arc/MetJ family transcriptional regulator
MTGVRRVQLDLPEKALQRLQDLKSRTEASSYAEVIKNALRLYEAIIEETEAGSSFLVRSADGQLKEYVIF